MMLLLSIGVLMAGVDHVIPAIPAWARDPISRLCGGQRTQACLKSLTSCNTDALPSCDNFQLVGNHDDTTGHFLMLNGKTEDGCQFECLMKSEVIVLKNWP